MPSFFPGCHGRVVRLWLRLARGGKVSVVSASIWGCRFLLKRGEKEGSKEDTWLRGEAGGGGGDIGEGRGTNG